ncbi:MAG: M48 family metallopeptidase [Planctomycetota bacterium]
MMIRSLRFVLIALVLLLGSACTAFGKLNLYSEAEEAQLGIQAYAEATAEYPEITSGPQYLMLQRVGQRIAAAAQKDYQWEFKLLRADDIPNAWCLPGGKVAVYTGILPLTQDEDGLAAVVGHEVAHATLRHGGKRMTQASILQAAMTAVGAGLSLTEMSDEAKTGVLTAFGLGSQVGVLLPYSRDHETEADVVGIRYAVRAGYDPYAAVALWERMAALGSGGPEWLSTHPHSEARAQKLRQVIPQIVAEEGKAPSR